MSIPVFSLNNTSAGCITYNPLTRLVSVTCSSVNLTDIYETLKKPEKILIKQSSKVWLLNANVVVENGATFYINSTDTSWLKINSTAGVAYYIQARGNLIIDSVTITSWDTIKNDYGKAIIHGNVIPRSYILVKDGTGMTNITNSEIAYLGYPHFDSFGLVYYTGAGSIIKNNNIHDMWYGFYSTGTNAHNITIQNNNFRRNNIYGIDPHSGTHHLIISNNQVYDNGRSGIICSVNCHDIVVEQNKVFNNAQVGIIFHRNVSSSFIKHNIIYDNKEDQILIQDSSYNNEIYGNSIKGGKLGIKVTQESERNNIHNNTITDLSNYGIYVLNGASENIIAFNTIVNPSIYALYVQDPNTNYNIFKYNKLFLNSQETPIKLSNLGKSHALFINNTVGALPIFYGGLDTRSIILIISGSSTVIIAIVLYLRRRLRRQRD